MTSCEINKLWEEKSARCSADPTTSWPTCCLPASFFVKCSCFASMFYVCWWIQLKNELYCTLIYNHSRVVMFFTAKKQKIKCWQLPVWQIKFNGPQNWFKTVSQTLWYQQIWYHCPNNQYGVVSRWNWLRQNEAIDQRDQRMWPLNLKLQTDGAIQQQMESGGPRDVRVVIFYSFYIYFFKWKW